MYIYHFILVFFPHPAQSPAALDPLQQAYAGMQHYTGWFTSSTPFCVTFSSLSEIKWLLFIY